MKAIVCIDDRNGMMFHHRRQSQDQLLRKDILDMAEGGRLWMNEYSRKQFTEIPETESDSMKAWGVEICVQEDFLDQAGEGDYCFVEDRDISPWAKKMETLILYRWNRKYPADVYLQLPLSGLRLVKTTEFAGFSHEKITKEVYER